jgi:hypothetical protein
MPSPSRRTGNSLLEIQRYKSERLREGRRRSLNRFSRRLLGSQFDELRDCPLREVPAAGVAALTRASDIENLDAVRPHELCRRARHSFSIHLQPIYHQRWLVVMLAKARGLRGPTAQFAKVDDKRTV